VSTNTPKTIDLRGLVRPTLVEMTPRDGHAAEFRIQPLERGFGHTLGNAMRRLLLSSLRGSAVWGIRIDGVVHEHQTIAGVIEDVHQVIGQLKALTLALDEDKEEVVLRISVSKAGAVTAADIQPQAGVSVLDPAHHILTLTEDRELNIELYVNKGRGYVEADQHVLDRAKGYPVDLVRVDSIYGPVRRVNFTVAETRVGQRTDYDRLAVVVETNGTVSPAEAVSYAAALAQTHFQYFANFGSALAGDAMFADASGPEGQRLAKLLETKIDDLVLSVRSLNSLKNANVRTIGDLVRMPEHKVLRIKNFGKKSLEEIAVILEQEKLNLGMQFEPNTDGGLRVVEWGTSPRDAAAQAPDEVDDEEE
jgi:DNA-directed RNA polymerase subunit alpha